MINKVISPLAVFNHNNYTLNFYCIEENKLIGKGEILHIENDIQIPWIDHNKIVENVVFDKSFKKSKIISLNSWFYNAGHLTKVDGMENIPWNQIIDISYMFYGCCSLKDIDISYFKNDKSFKFLDVFKNCFSLETVKLFNVDIDKYYDRIFKNCISFDKLQLKQSV